MNVTTESNSLESLICPTRRAALKAGVLGLSLPQLMALQSDANESPNAGKAKNVLVILEQGGMSHIDTWDPKPGAPVDHRSPHAPISTSVSGMQFSELFQLTARHADKLSVIRSMYHPIAGANGHPKGTQYMLSGAHPASVPERPDIGSVVSTLMGSKCRYLPPYIMVPGNSEQAKESRTGFLSDSTQVFKTGGRDVSLPDWKVNDLLPRSENETARLEQRMKLLSDLDQSFSRPVRGMNQFYEQAFDTLSNQRVSKAFDLTGEAPAVREPYGPGHRGACYLQGRKLIEAGVRFVTVDVRWPRNETYPEGGNLNWDHHDYIYTKGTCNLPGAGGGGRGRYGIATWPMMGSVDRAFSALLEDMQQRGLLEETLVCFVTEFGRTPKINKFQGRDHWTEAYSIAMAGAGVPGGQVVGKSDKDGGYVIEAPHTPEEYAVTIYEKLGIDRHTPLYTSESRPVYFGHAGDPIAEVF